MSKKIKIGGLLIIILTVGLLMAIGFNTTKNIKAETVYLVYLDGKKIGMLEDNEELYDLIDAEQESIKQNFEVEKVYPPAELKTIESKTYSKERKSAKDIYNIIEKESTFTIKGYTITITKNDEKPKYINILNKEDLEPALMNAISAFVSTDGLQAYINDNQIEITDTGKTIEKVYFEEKITIKENYLNVNEMIITNENDLTKYLLFGTLEKQADYTVKEGDSVETVAYNNKLSNEELLIANPQLASINSLLSPGQKLNIGLINPLFTIVEESEVIEDVEAAYDTVTEKNNSLYASQSYVKQEGKKGINRVTEKVLYKNGEIKTLYVTHTKTISEPVDKIVVKGTRPSYNFNYYPPAASSTDWGWPTVSPYVITSYYGYRWGKLHGGIDISGCGYGTPLYASNDGVVTKVFAGCSNKGYYGSPCGGGYGNYLEIKTTSGLFVEYAHIMNDIRVKVGDNVTKGQAIGFMGNSGSSTGTHLHYEIRDANGVRYNPCKVAFAC